MSHYYLPFVCADATWNEWGKVQMSVDNRIIIIKDDSTNLLDENGRFDISVKLLSRKHGAYQIRLYAADNSSENPNFGLVDSTIVRVPINMNGKQKDKHY